MKFAPGRVPGRYGADEWPGARLLRMNHLHPPLNAILVKKWGWVSALVAALGVVVVTAVPPSTDFKNLPDRVFYFEDTTVSV